MKDPAFLFYSSDFLTGTITMTNEQVGKYIKLLCLQHQKGRLTKKDMLFICQTYDEDVFSKFECDDEDFYYNKRLKMETDKRNEYSKSRSLNRNAKKSSYEQHMSNICETYVEHMENENININEDVILYKDIVNHLNLKAKTQFKHTSRKTRDLIKTRLKEGFVLADFKTVIDKKCDEWIGTEYEKFLRPETLFSNKFEGYLNQNIVKLAPKPTNKPANMGNFTQRPYDEELMKKLDESW